MIYKKKEYEPEISVKGCFVAGGSILSLKSRQKINDYDLYPKDQTRIIDIIQDLIQNEKCFVIAESDRSITLKSNNLRHDDGSRMIIQVITIQDFPTPESIFETFDFTVCMAAFDCDTNEFHYHESFWEDLGAKTLNFNPNTKYPYASLVRTRKYTDKGFSLSKGELLKIALTIANHGMTNSWTELCQQIGGIYGHTIQLETEGLEFNFENAIKVLSETDFRLHPFDVDTSDESSIAKLYNNMDTYEKYLMRSEFLKNGKVDVLSVNPYDFVIYNNEITKYYFNESYMFSTARIPVNPKNKDHTYELPEGISKVLSGIDKEPKKFTLTGCIAKKGMYDDTELFVKRYVNYQTVNEFIPASSDEMVTVFTNLGDAIEQMQEIDPDGDYSYEKVRFNTEDVSNAHSHNMFNILKSKLEVL